MKIVVKSVPVKLPPPPPSDIQLTIDQEFASLLWTVCNHIGGDVRGPRGDFDKLQNKLSQLDVKPYRGTVTGSGINF